MSSWLDDNRPTLPACQAAIKSLRRPMQPNGRIRLQFEADLLAFTAPSLSAFRHSIRLPQGFLAENRGRFASDAETDRFDEASASQSFVYLECPLGAVEIGAGVTVHAIFLRRASIVEAGGQLRLVSTPSRLDAVFGCDGDPTECFASWRLDDFSDGQASALWAGRCEPRLDIAGRTRLPLERILRRVQRIALLAIIDALAQAGPAPATAATTDARTTADASPSGLKRAAVHFDEIQVLQPNRGDLL